MSQDNRRANNGGPRCPRCVVRAMIWVQSSWYCPACKFKQGCCG